MEDYKTHSCLEYQQDADHAQILNRRRSMSVNIHTLLGVSVIRKVQIQPQFSSDSTIVKSDASTSSPRLINFSNAAWSILHYPLEHQLYIRNILQVCISIVEAKQVTYRVKLTNVTFFYKRNTTTIYLFLNTIKIL